MISTKEVEGIILSSQDYKEKDALVTILLEDQILTFLARGVHKQNAKNRLLIRPFTYVQISLTGKGMPLMTTGTVLSSFHNIFEDLTAQAVLNVLVDCLKKTTIQKELFDAFLSCLESFHTNDGKRYTWACLVLKEILKEEGISIYVNGCVLCHRFNNIESISLQDGGFICQTCNNGRIRKYTKPELLRFRSLFVYPKNREKEFVDYATFTMEDVLFLMQWFMYYTNYHFSSFSFLQSILNL